MAEDKIFMMAVDKALEQAGEAAEYKHLFHKMCKYYLSLIDGDTHYVTDALNLMEDYDIVDENGEVTSAFLELIDSNDN